MIERMCDTTIAFYEQLGSSVISVLDTEHKDVAVYIADAQLHAKVDDAGTTHATIETWNKKIPVQRTVESLVRLLNERAMKYVAKSEYNQEVA